MNGSSYIRHRQQLWALRNNVPQRGGSKSIDPNARGYTQKLEDNLYLALSDESKLEFQSADGGELRGSVCHMQALHSSSALGVNLFEYWRNQDLNAFQLLGKSLEIPSNIQSFEFEHKMEHAASNNRSDFPKSPNFDVLIRYTDRAIGVECKFSEPYDSKPKGLKQAYLKYPDLWEDIPNIKKLADQISPKDELYVHLHPAQLIKHVLALKHQYAKSKFWLMYLWYDVPTSQGDKHREEIIRFGEILQQDGIRFHPLSYQEVIHNMYDYGIRDQHGDYLDFLAERYL